MPVAGSLPLFTPFLNVAGVVIDTVRELGGQPGLSGQIGAGGPVLAAVNGVLALNGTAGALEQPDAVISHVLGINRVLELGKLVHRFETYSPIGLDGLSLHFTMQGTTESSNGNGQLIIETLVRERQLLIQLFNTYASVGRHVAECCLYSSAR